MRAKGWFHRARAAADILSRARGDERFKAFLPLSLRRRIILNEGAPRPPLTVVDDAAAELKRLTNRLRAEALDENGLVDYRAVRGSQTFAELEQTAAALASADLGAIESDAARLAFWINLYNVLTIHGVVALGVRESVMEYPRFFSLVGYRVGGHELTLDEIEHGVLRRNRPGLVGGPPFAEGDARIGLAPARLDPRVHFALVCGARSCPPVAFYSSEGVDAQLELAARGYVAAHVELDAAARTIHMPELLRVYGEDFGGPAGVWRFVTERAGEVEGAAIARAREDGWSVSWSRYDWSLNAAG